MSAKGDRNGWLAVGGGAVALVGIQLFTSADPLGRTARFFRLLNVHEKKLTTSTSLDAGIEDYNEFHHRKSVEERNTEYKSLVNAYYDLATVFYEWGWGESFHFAYRFPFESFHESIRRHEYYLASRLMLQNTTQKILDVGCGIGGPMRNISRFTGNDITGITINPYQVERGNELCAKVGLSQQARSVQGDFMDMPFTNNTFDAAYAIEATCHAPNRTGVYSEIYRVLKPGSVFCCYEWCLTDKFDHTNPTHLKIKKQIEEGDGLPDIAHTSVCLQALREVGFEILDERDLALDPYQHTPWYLPMVPSWFRPWSQRFQLTWLGVRMSNFVLSILECMYLAPKGTTKTQRMLQQAAFGLSGGGQAGIFTAMYLMVGRVPLDKKSDAVVVKQ